MPVCLLMFFYCKSFDLKNPEIVITWLDLIDHVTDHVPVKSSETVNIIDLLTLLSPKEDRNVNSKHKQVKDPELYRRQGEVAYIGVVGSDRQGLDSTVHTN